MRSVKWASVVVGVMVLISACASGGRCNTDTCYNQRDAAVDAFRNAEVVAWGVTEKEDGQKEQDEKGSRRIASEKESEK